MAGITDISYSWDMPTTQSSYSGGGYSPLQSSLPRQQQQQSQGGTSPQQLVSMLKNGYNIYSGLTGAGGLAGTGLSQAGLSSAISSSMFGSGAGLAGSGTSLASIGSSFGGMSGGLGGLLGGSGAAAGGAGAGGAGAAASGGMAALASNPVGWVIGGLSAPFIASSDPETFGSLGAVGSTGEALNGLWHGKGLQEFFDTDMLATHFIPGADLTNTLGITNDSTWDFLSPVGDFFGDIFGF